jgi:ribonucleotide reductase alpha subunit
VKEKWAEIMAGIEDVDGAKEEDRVRIADEWRETKKPIWEGIREAAIKKGATKLAKLDWCNVRDNVWGGMKKDAFAKKAKIDAGNLSVEYNEVNK